jgi:PAS domain S-box-containing protein
MAFNGMVLTRKEAEERLREYSEGLEEQFRLVSQAKQQWQETFDSITDMVSIHDKDFNIIRANIAFAKYFGLHPREVINRKCYEVFHVTDSPVVGCPHKITLDENRPVTKEILDSKTNRIFRISTFPYYSPEGDIIGSVHIARDITEEKEKEVRLIMSERLAALGQMAAGIAHEINNPLAAIAGCAEGLLSRVMKGRFEPELFKNYLKIISEEISRCKSITTSMLSFVRKTTYEKKEININEALDKTLEIVGFQGRLQKVEIIKNYKEDMPVVYGSEGELRQGCLSIITNALDAMDDTGAITLETGIEGDTVFIKITDTGPGIPQQHLNRIFDPFFTTKSDKGGTGLGLSIANKIVANHSGAINVISEEGKGTTFKIILPM